MNVNVISEFSCRPFAFVWILFATRRFAVRGHAEVIYWRNKWKTLADFITDNIIYDSRRMSRKPRCRVCVCESCVYKWMKWVYRPSVGRRNLRCERISYLVGAYEWTLISSWWFDSVGNCTPHSVKSLLTFGTIAFFVASLFSISDAHTVDHSWRWLSTEKSGRETREETKRAKSWSCHRSTTQTHTFDELFVFSPFNLDTFICEFGAFFSSSSSKY